MFGHNNQGTAEDVSVRCRIRRSAFASNKESAQEEDAVCTMRVWHSAGTSFVDLTSAVPLRLRKNKSQEYKSESKENGCWGSETHDSDSQSSRRSSSKKQRRQQQKQKQKQQRLQQQQQQQQQQQEQIDQRSRALGPQLIFTTICPVGTLDNSNLRNSRMVNAFTDTSSFGNENGRRMGRRPSAFGGDQAECKLSEHHARQMEQQSWHDERHRGGRESPAQTAAAAAGATSAEPVIVPTRDIMLVETATAENHETMCTITTISHGFYECVFDSNNGKMVFVAFLQNYLSENRFVDPTKRARRANNAVSPSSSSLASTDGASFDVEAFTAHRMAERIQTETTTEKVRRKIGRIASSLDECKCGVRIVFALCVCVRDCAKCARA
uniref:Uncharacterized protein n=1 Tax=Craspedostauros australis TaxID=1486917 RepID=A0A7R9WYK4_9STRA|mmetsp:Transcript_4251/g.11105  ORF Transcript_4251/g.11105 Transcript_4251/m.11105 type:complete len:382 (+) Transcript_4251:288-1433(+)